MFNSRQIERIDDKIDELRKMQRSRHKQLYSILTEPKYKKGSLVCARVWIGITIHDFKGYILDVKLKGGDWGACWEYTVLDIAAKEIEYVPEYDIKEVIEEEAINLEIQTNQG